MKFAKSLSLLLIVNCLVALLSCKKTEGPPGPAGPSGPAGPAGNPAIKSITVQVVTSDWQVSNTATHTTLAEKNIPEITTSVYEKGSVIVSWQISGAWVALPFTYPVTYPGGGTNQTMGYSYTPGKLTVFVMNADGTLPVGLTTATLKAVVTEGS